jgi:hypothetical protein
MTPALPPAPAIGDTMTALAFPLRTWRRHPVRHTGKVVGVGAHVITILTPDGYYSARPAEASRTYDDRKEASGV